MKTQNDFSPRRRGDAEKISTFRFVAFRFCLALLCASAPLRLTAQTSVLFPLAQMTGTTNDTTITIKPINNPVDFNSQIYWLPTAGIQLKTVNGSATTNLIPNDYTVTISGVPGSWRISVNDTNVTLNAALIGNLTTYTFNAAPPFVQQLLAGPNITLAPTNGKGVVTVSSSGGGGGGSATNVYFVDGTGTHWAVVNNSNQVNVTGFQPASTTLTNWSLLPTNVFDTRYDLAGTALAIGLQATNFANAIGLANTNFTIAATNVVINTVSNWNTESNVQNQATFLPIFNGTAYKFAGNGTFHETNSFTTTGGFSIGKNQANAFLSFGAAGAEQLRWKLATYGLTIVDPISGQLLLNWGPPLGSTWDLQYQDSAIATTAANNSGAPIAVNVDYLGGYISGAKGERPAGPEIWAAKGTPWIGVRNDSSGMGTAYTNFVNVAKYFNTSQVNAALSPYGIKTWIFCDAGWGTNRDASGSLRFNPNLLGGATSISNYVAMIHTNGVKLAMNIYYSSAPFNHINGDTERVLNLGASGGIDKSYPSQIQAGLPYWSEITPETVEKDVVWFYTNNVDEMFLADSVYVLMQGKEAQIRAFDYNVLYPQTAGNLANIFWRNTTNNASGTVVGSVNPGWNGTLTNQLVIGAYVNRPGPQTAYCVNDLSTDQVYPISVGADPALDLIMSYARTYRDFTTNWPAGSFNPVVTDATVDFSHAVWTQRQYTNFYSVSEMMHANTQTIIDTNNWSWNTNQNFLTNCPIFLTTWADHKRAQPQWLMDDGTNACLIRPIDNDGYLVLAANQSGSDSNFNVSLTNFLPTDKIFTATNIMSGTAFGSGLLTNTFISTVAATNRVYVRLQPYPQFNGDGSSLTNLIHSTTMSAVSGISYAKTTNSDGSYDYAATVTASGSGDFTGPASSTADDFVSFNGTTGKAGKDSGKSAASFALVANNLSDLASAASARANLSAAATNYGTTLEKRFADGTYMRTNTAEPHNWEVVDTNGNLTIGTNGVTQFSFARDGSGYLAANNVNWDSLGTLSAQKLSSSAFSANAGVYSDTSLQLHAIPTGAGLGTNNNSGGFGYTMWPAVTGINVASQAAVANLVITNGATNLSLTASTVTVSDANKKQASLANGGNNTLIHGTSPPAYSAVVEADLGLTDLTTANVSTTTHGFAPKLPNDATKYLDGTGAYSVPAGGGGGSGLSSSLVIMGQSANATIGGGSRLMFAGPWVQGGGILDHGIPVGPNPVTLTNIICEISVLGAGTNFGGTIYTNVFGSTGVDSGVGCGATGTTGGKQFSSGTQSLTISSNCFWLPVFTNNSGSSWNADLAITVKVTGF